MIAWWDKKGGLRAAFLLVSLLGLRPAVAGEGDLAAHPQWLALLHTHEGAPLVRDPAFLLSLPDFSPATELRATLALLQGPDAEAAACRFPARALWLQARGALPVRSLGHCTELQEFRQRAPMTQLSLVFASETLSQPSSMMGHVFLKLSGRVADGSEREHALSFYTEPVTWNVPKLFYDSLIKGMPGYFTLAPYREQVENYVERESRNLWEYPLRLDAEQRTLVQAHLIELKPVAFTYYFQRYNCATLVKQVLAVAEPQVLQQRDLWTTPKDVVRAAQSAELLDGALALSAPRWTLHILDGSLRADEVVALKRDVATGVLPAPMPDDAARGFLRLKAAAAYNHQLLRVGERPQAAWLAYQRQVDARLGQAEEALELQSDARLNPLAAPPDAQAAVGWQRRAGRDSLVVEFLPTSHRLEDRNDMYFSESALRLFDLALAQSLDGRGARVERATVYAVESLLPRDRFAGGWSGRFKLGYEPQWGTTLQSQGAFVVEGGLGLTTRWARDIDAFAIAGAGVGVRRKAYAYANPTLGLIVRQVFDMKAVVTASWWHNALGSGRSAQEWRWTQSKYLSGGWTLVGSAAAWHQDGQRRREAELRIKRLF